MNSSCSPIANFKSTPPPVLGIIVGSNITVITLAIITALCIWLNTGALLPFAALGVVGTIGFVSLLGIITVGSFLLLTIAALCIASCVIERKLKKEVVVQAERKAQDAERTQSSIWRVLKDNGCTGLLTIDNEGSCFHIRPPKMHSKDSLPGVIDIPNRTSGGRSLSPGEYIIHLGENTDAHIIFQNSLGTKYFYCPDIKFIDAVEERTTALAGL